MDRRKGTNNDLQNTTQQTKDGEVPGGSMDYLTTHTSLSPIRCGFVPGFVNYKKGALDSQP